MVTGDQVAISKKTVIRLKFGGYMYPANVLKDGPASECKHGTQEMMLGTGGLAVSTEHKYKVVSRRVFSLSQPLYLARNWH